MKASELRIGNYVCGLKMEEPIRRINDSIQYNYKTERYELDDIDLDCFEPIPLTEEWLLKFGFESNPYQDRYENKVIQVECNKLRGYTELWIDGMPHIKYIHQLQNLYFALTGQELEIKE